MKTLFLLLVLSVPAFSQSVQFFGDKTTKTAYGIKCGEISDIKGGDNVPFFSEEEITKAGYTLSEKCSLPKAGRVQMPNKTSAPTPTSGPRNRGGKWLYDLDEVEKTTSNYFGRGDFRYRTTLCASTLDGSYHGFYKNRIRDYYAFLAGSGFYFYMQREKFRNLQKRYGVSGDCVKAVFVLNFEAEIPVKYSIYSRKSVIVGLIVNIEPYDSE